MKLPPRNPTPSKLRWAGFARPFIALLFPLLLTAESVALPGLRAPVEILRDRWGVPHLYAQSTADLFFAQGYMAARDRLFQIDLWRRAGLGQLAEVLGPSAIERDRLARAIRFRGSMDAEWAAYAPGTREAVTQFTRGINAYIASLHGARPLEFRAANYDPTPWQPEDCLARLSSLQVTRNLQHEVQRSLDIQRYGLAVTTQLNPPHPTVPVTVPNGLDLADIVPELLTGYQAALGPADFSNIGSNNWVVDGTRTASGKPLLANDPHRGLETPSLRKTVHLVAPGYNAIGAGEPALPGIALGHNERIAFGFTIVGTDQQDLYVEKLNPANRNQYWYRGAWKNFEVERQQLRVRGSRNPEPIELRYTVHGPVLYTDHSRQRAYALRWTGSEPGTAAYIAGLDIARAQNYAEFSRAVERYRMPAENIVYADVDGNIAWRVTGLAPIRPNWNGLLPVPGSGEYEWSGFRNPAQLPQMFNPPDHFIATANHNITGPQDRDPLGYEWSPGFRIQRIWELLKPASKLTVADCERFQQDIVSIPARRLAAVLRRALPKDENARELIDWNAALRADSRAALIYAAWVPRLLVELFGEAQAARTPMTTLLAKVESGVDPAALAKSLQAAINDVQSVYGPDRNTWTWGRLHRAAFKHPLNQPAWNRGPISRGGDADTVNAAAGLRFQQTEGATYRQVIDLADWDRSTMTNTPGESGDPSSPHYADLLDDWANGRYHPMPFSRKAVEAATTERITLTPGR